MDIKDKKLQNSNILTSNWLKMRHNRVQNKNAGVCYKRVGMYWSMIIEWIGVQEYPNTFQNLSLIMNLNCRKVTITSYV